MNWGLKDQTSGEISDIFSGAASNPGRLDVENMPVMLRVDVPADPDVNAFVFALSYFMFAVEMAVSWVAVQELPQMYKYRVDPGEVQVGPQAQYALAGEADVNTANTAITVIDKRNCNFLIESPKFFLAKRYI